MAVESHEAGDEGEAMAGGIPPKATRGKDTRRETVQERMATPKATRCYFHVPFNGLFSPANDQKPLAPRPVGGSSHERQAWIACYFSPTRR